MIFNILDNTTELWMTKYLIGEIFSSGGATLYKNPSDQTVPSAAFGIDFTNSGTATHSVKLQSQENSTQWRRDKKLVSQVKEFVGRSSFDSWPQSNGPNLIESPRPTKKTIVNKVPYSTGGG